MLRNVLLVNAMSTTIRPPLQVNMPLGKRLAEVAAYNREALLAFVNGVADGWERRDLAAWLVGPYRLATWHPTEPAFVAHDVALTLSHAAIDETLHEARFYVVAALQALATAGGARDFDELPFVVQARRTQGIVPACDELGNTGWVAINDPRGQLPRRLGAVLAVDALVHWHHYPSRIRFCARCERLAFARPGDPCARCSGKMKSDPRVETRDE
jgi:hypothetical protein